MSITGQVGHVSIAKQTAKGTAQTNTAKHIAVKITGDSLVANNNMLVAEGEIGAGRDVTQAIPGGFSTAGAINGNLRARAASVLIEAGFGATSKTLVPDAPGTNEAYDTFEPTDDLPWLTVEKKIGTTDPELLVLRYTDVMVNTLNLTVPSAGLATFSAGLVSIGEEKVTAATHTPTYSDTSDDLLVFHGGRIRNDDTGSTLVGTGTGDGTVDETFQSFEVVLNNNVATDEYTIRPSRFLRSLTEGIRSVELNITLIFEDDAKYEQYTYGALGRTKPGYNFYNGAVDLTLANWQIADEEEIYDETPTGAPTNPQGFRVELPKVAFTGLPVALASGRIAVTTTARALKPSSGEIITADVFPSAVGLPA